MIAKSSRNMEQSNMTFIILNIEWSESSSISMACCLWWSKGKHRNDSQQKREQRLFNTWTRKSANYSECYDEYGEKYVYRIRDFIRKIHNMSALHRGYRLCSCVYNKNDDNEDSNNNNGKQTSAVHKHSRSELIITRRMNLSFTHEIKSTYSRSHIL